MDDLVVVVLIVFAVFNAVRNGKKKKKKGQSAGPALSAKQKRAAAQKDRQADFSAAFARSHESAESEAKTKAAKDERLHGPGIHLHSVTQAQMSEAQEGEDPCHAGSAPALTAEETPQTLGDPLRGAMADDLLRGVIMSEILTRPCQRQTAIRRKTKA